MRCLEETQITKVLLGIGKFWLFSQTDEIGESQLNNKYINYIGYMLDPSGSVLYILIVLYI